jgi:phosphate transport system substrate-binding protein
VRAGLVLATTLCLSLIALPAVARDQIQIVGSSTVFPFSTAVAEQFGRSTDFKTPIVESTGTGGGFKLFCAGVGLATPDIANASRRMKISEFEMCGQNGVVGIVEVRIGYDGIVIAAARDAEPMQLTTKQIFLALARQIPVNDKLVDNPNRTWKDVDASLPDARIEVLGPPPTSGTRDAFVELAMEGGAKQIPYLAALKEKDKKAFKAVAHAIREDGAYVEAGENDNLIVQKLVANPQALGIFGFSFLDQNGDRVRGSVINGVAPSFDAIADGQYPVSRSLYFYVKKAHVGEISGLTEFVAEFLSNRASGEDGYLAEKGLIPLLPEDRKKVKASAEALEVLELN